MLFNWKIGKLTVWVLIWLVGSGASAPAQTSAPTAKNTKTAPAAQDEEARLKKYLDKDGGYKTKDGGYYNPKAGTYTDKDGLIADNWSGVTYTDGSYKSGLGDFYEAPTKTYKLADGRVAKVPNLTPAEAIKALRDNVAANDGYDKDMTLKSMMTRIKLDHPLVPVKPKP
jgi:hypothetical protein